MNPPLERGQNLTPAKIAARWGTSSTFVYNLLNSGDLPGFKLGNKLWRVRPEDVEAYECRPTGN